MAARLRLSATRLARRLRQEAGTGLTPSQLSALATVHNHGPLTLGSLAEREQVAPPSITKVVAKLEADGLLQRSPDPTDRRVSHVAHHARPAPTSSTRAAAARRPGSPTASTSWPTTSGTAWPPRLDVLDQLIALEPQDPDVTRLRGVAADTFRSLHVRNFRLFFTGQLISQVGNWLTLIAQTLLVLKLTDSGIALGLLAAFQFGPVLIFGAFAGLVADRIGQAQAAAHRADAGDGPVLHAGRPGLQPPPAGAGRSTSWRCSAASPWPSTTPPAARSSSRWCPRRT